MKKIYTTAPNTVEIKDVPIPTPAPGELLIKTELSGISAGTEMMIYQGTFPNFELKKWPQWSEYPVCPGYELVGTVVAIGEEVKEEKNMSQLDSLQPKSATLLTTASEFKVGDRVVCLGEHAEYACLPAEFVAKIPDNVSSKEATLAVLGTTSTHCLHRADIDFGDTVAIIGAGVLGYLATQQLKVGGASKVIVIDMDESRLEIAKKAGADVVLNPTKCDIVKEIEKVNNGILADVVIEASGAKGTEQTALDIVRDRGKVVVLGWHTSPMNFQFGDFYFKEVTLIATRAGGPEAGLPYAYIRWTTDQSLKNSIKLISEGKVTGKYFEPSVFHYTEIEDVYKMISNRDSKIGMQAMLKWD